MDRFTRCRRSAEHFSHLSLLQITILICFHVAAVFTFQPSLSSGHTLSQDTLASLNRDTSTVLTLDFYRELWARRIDGTKAPPASAFLASSRPSCAYKHSRGFDVQFTLLRPPLVEQTHKATAALCQEAIYNLEMAEFGHLHDADAHVPGAMHWLNSHGFAVTQMEGPDIHDRVVSAHGYSNPTLPCILLESPTSLTSSMLAQAAVCVHVWPRWRVTAADLFSATHMPHMLIAFHFYTPFIEAPVNAPLPANWWTAPSTPSNIFHSHHEASSGSADVSLAFVGLHSALSLFNSSTCLLLLPGWQALDLGGDVIGNLAALRMLVVHGNVFAVAAVADIRDESSPPASAATDASIHADVALSASVEKTFFQRVNESAANMRLPVLSVSAAALNSGGLGYSAPLAVRVGVDATEELHRLLKCVDAFEGNDGECCLIDNACDITSAKHRDNARSSSSSSDGGGVLSSCPPATFHMCVAQGWLCRSRPRVVWDRSHLFQSNYSFFFLNELLILKLRLEEIGDLVDKIVIIEATTTYRNGTRPIVIQSVRNVFGKNWHKVVHVIVDDMPAYSDDPWRREYHQRAALLRGLAGASSDDLVLFSDLDEIPRAAVLDAMRWCDDKMPPIMAMQSRVFMHDVSRMKDRWWHAPVVFPVGLMDDALSPKMIRILGHHRRLPWWTNGAWHFTFFGSTSSVKHKLSSFSDGVDDKYKKESSINFRVSNGVHLLDHDKDISIERLLHPDVDLPRYITNNPSMFRFTYVDIVGEGSHMQPMTDIDNQPLSNLDAYEKGSVSWCDGYRKHMQGMCSFTPQVKPIVSTCHCNGGQLDSCVVDSDTFAINTRSCTQIIVMSNFSLPLLSVHNSEHAVRFTATVAPLSRDLHSCWMRSADAIILPPHFQPLSPKPPHQLWIADLSQPVINNEHSNSSFPLDCDLPSWSDAALCFVATNQSIVFVQPFGMISASYHAPDVTSWPVLATQLSEAVRLMCSNISHVATPLARFPWPAVFIMHPQWTGTSSQKYKILPQSFAGQKISTLQCFKFYSLHARPGMNVIVRRDVGPYYVLGGGSGNETTYYEFEKGVQVDPGYHVYQVWLVDSRWRTVSFDDVVFELLP